MIAGAPRNIRGEGGGEIKFQLTAAIVCVGDKQTTPPRGIVCYRIKGEDEDNDGVEEKIGLIFRWVDGVLKRVGGGCFVICLF